MKGRQLVVYHPPPVTPPAPRLVPPFPSLKVIRLIKIVFSPPPKKTGMPFFVSPFQEGAGLNG